MKFLISLLLLCAPLHAGLLATFHTTRGNVVVELQYDKTPQTVANFITLADGTRPRIDPLTGAVVRKPLYAGERFFRVVNSPGFRIAQTGSGTGTNSGGPGYTFRDEFHPDLRHVPYVLAMANTGEVHDNGSQIYLTGSYEIPSLNDKHTVFGLIKDAASRAVVDAIMEAESDTTTINSVGFSRTTPQAVAFDEHAQRLPVCSGIAGALKVSPGVSVGYEFVSPQPGGSVFQVYQSQDLRSWVRLGGLYQGSGQSGFPQVTFGNASLPRAFYHMPLVTYPDALSPASMGGRTLVVGLFGDETFTFQFDATGNGGTMTYSAEPDAPGTILAVSYAPSGPYGAEWIIETSGYLPFRFYGIMDTETPSSVFGTNTSDYYSDETGWEPLSAGVLVLSK